MNLSPTPNCTEMTFATVLRLATHSLNGDIVCDRVTSLHMIHEVLGTRKEVITFCYDFAYMKKKTMR